MDYHRIVYEFRWKALLCQRDRLATAERRAPLAFSLKQGIRNNDLRGSTQLGKFSIRSLPALFRRHLLTKKAPFLISFGLANNRRGIECT